MKFSSVFVVIVICCSVPHTFSWKRISKSKNDADFEFADDEESRLSKVSKKRKWFHNPKSEMCRPLGCKRYEICLIEEGSTATCVSKKELYKSRDAVVFKHRNKQLHTLLADETQESKEDDPFFDLEADEEDQNEMKCEECPISKPKFLCGSDNRTYSSPCRLRYHNCIQHSSVHIICSGFCPCKNTKHHTSKYLLRPRAKNNQKISYNAGSVMKKNFDSINHYHSVKNENLKKASRNLSEYYHYFNNDIGEESNVPAIKLNDSDRGSETIFTNCTSNLYSLMSSRLLDWFSVLINDPRHLRSHFNSKGHFPIGCQREVKWMFGHLDANSDGKVSLLELHGLEHDKNEPCLKPFLDNCDVNRDSEITGYEWCGRFSKAKGPCTTIKNHTPLEYAPNCDHQGYFRSLQCYEKLKVCWCVNKHGTEYPNTRLRGIKPDCDSVYKGMSINQEMNNANLEDEEDSNQDMEGSAEQLLNF